MTGIPNQSLLSKIPASIIAMVRSSVTRSVKKLQAFMLIELVVASFVIGVAFLGLMALLHSGQQASGNCEGETQAALFAENVMTSFRLLNEKAATDNDHPQAWCDLWEQLSSGVTYSQLPCFASDVWSDSGEKTSVKTDGKVHTCYWFWRRDNETVSEDTIADNAITYRILINPSEEETDYIDDNGSSRQAPRYYTVMLHIWNGASRISNPDATYFSLFANCGKMP